MKMTETHHISYNPEITVEIPLKLHHEIHGTEPNTSELSMLMRQYDKLVQLSVMLKNWRMAYQKEFNHNPINVEQITVIKREILKDVKEIINGELKEVQHLKGLGTRYLAGLLAYAHPNRFSNLHKFLHYCGYKGSSKVTKKYNRRVSAIVHQISKSLLMHKDPKYYTLYKSIRTDLETRYPKYIKARIFNMTLKRVGTFLLKEVYKIFHEPVETRQVFGEDLLPS